MILLVFKGFLGDFQRIFLDSLRFSSIFERFSGFFGDSRRFSKDFGGFLNDFARFQRILGRFSSIFNTFVAFKANFDCKRLQPKSFRITE